MVTCKLYIFEKKRNSTKQPTLITPYVQEGEIKQDFSPLAFTLTFNFSGTLQVPPYNYTYVDELQRYYFIEDWTFTGGLWVASCTVDALATFKTQIGQSTQFVSRAYSSYDASIIDTTYLSKTDGVERKYSTISPTSFWGANPADNSGLIVAGIIGTASGAIGPTTYYAMSITAFQGLLNSLLSSITWAGISTTEISEELQKALINPIQYIVSAKWFPIQASSFTAGTATTSVKLGYWTFSVSSARILSTVSSAIVERSTYVDIPKATQSLGDTGARLQYVNLAPFAEYVLKFLPFGVFTLDSVDLFDMSQLGLKVTCNLLSGDAVLKVSAKTATGSFMYETAPILNVQSQIGVDLPLAQITIDATKWKQGLGGGAASIGASLEGVYKELLG